MPIYLHEQSLRLTNGIEGVLCSIDSAEPATFVQAISRPNTAPRRQIHGQLFRAAGADPSPAVIVVPGSAGVVESHVHKAKLLTEAGISALIIDPFGARGVASTVANQAQYSFAASAWDVLAATAWLGAQNGINASQIGAQGHSRGGAAVLSAAAMRKFCQDSAHPKGVLRGVYAAYPWCGQQFLNPGSGETQVRAIIGDQDEWCSPQQVQGYIQALRLTGAAASCRIVANAHHSFDRFEPLTLEPEASVAPGAPTVYIDDDGRYLHPVNGVAPEDTGERELMLYGIKAGYGRRGAWLGAAEGEADLFHQDMMQFWHTLWPNV